MRLLHINKFFLKKTKNRNVTKFTKNIKKQLTIIFSLAIMPTCRQKNEIFAPF